MKAVRLVLAVLALALGCNETTVVVNGGDGGSGGTAGTGGMAGSGGTGGAEDLCRVGADCTDGNDCTDDVCNAADGSCSNPMFTDGTTCSADENPGRCVSGACTGLCEFVSCGDGNECTRDLCDPAHGSCFNPPVSDGTTCDAGGDPGRCSAGLCVGLCVDVDCSDGKECTEDLCDRGDGSCSNPNRPDGSECDFGSLPGRCQSGTCVDAELCRDVDCSDGNDCTEDVCNPATALCSNPNKVDEAFCEVGGNPGLCSAGHCRGLCEFVSCVDGNQCTVDMCDPSNGSCPNPDKADNTPCDYGDDPGRCSGGICVGLCTGVICNDHNQCTSDACNPDTGSCTFTNRVDGTSCDFSAVAGICEDGECVREGNVCPVVSSVTVDPAAVPEGGTGTVEVVAEDPDDNPETLVTQLSAREGTIADPNARTTTYVCDPSVGGVIAICVVASDGDPSCDVERCTSVLCPGEPPANTCPIIEAITATPMAIPPGETTTIVRVDATDPDEFPVPMRLEWSAGTGVFDDRFLSETTFTCGDSGPVQVCAKANDGDPECNETSCITVRCPSDIPPNLCPQLFVINAVPRRIPDGETSTLVEARGQDTDGFPLPLTLTLNALWGSFENTETIQEPFNVVAQNATYVCDRPGPVEICVDATDGACTKTLCDNVVCPAE